MYLCLQLTTNNNKMGILLKLLSRLLCGCLIGAAIVISVLYLIHGNEAFYIVYRNIDIVIYFSSLLLACVLFYVTLKLHINLHKVGQMIGGLATGYKFLSIGFFNYSFVKTDNRLRWRKNDIAGTSGECVMYLDRDIDIEQDSAPYFWYYAGGITTNIIVSVICFIIAKHADNSTFMGLFVHSSFTMMAFVGILIALYYGIPMKFGNGTNNDGRDILMLSRSARNRRIFVRSFQMIGEMVHGTKDTPKEWFSSEFPTGGNDYYGIISYISYIELLECEGHWDEARIAYERLGNIKPKLPLFFELETASGHIIAELLTLNRREVVEKLWTEQAEKFTTGLCKYLPSKLAALYAIELLHNKDEKKALQLYEELQTHKDMFYIPGLMTTALSIVEQIKQGCNKRL